MTLSHVLELHPFRSPFQESQETQEQKHLFLGNRGYCKIIFRKQGNSSLDYWDQGNTNLLSIAIMISSTMNRRLNKQTNMGSNDKLLGIKRTSQTFLGSREPGLKEFYGTSNFHNGEHGIKP